MGQPLEIQVDSDVQVARAQVPRRLIEALRRHLRDQVGAPTTAGRLGDNELLSLMLEQQARLRLPQALLSRVIELCRRQGVDYNVIDRRASVSCTTLRSSATLRPEAQQVAFQLLLRDSGVLVAPDRADRVALAADLIARRSQRTLVVTLDDQSAADWQKQLQTAFATDDKHVSQLKQSLSNCSVAIGSYAQTLALSPSQRQHFGFAVLDCIDTIDPVSLMRLVRSLPCRFLLGLAASAQRADGLERPLFVAVGDIAAELFAPLGGRPIQLGFRRLPTSFCFSELDRAHYQALLATLASDPQRNEQIVADVCRQAGSGANCLMLSERKDQLDALDPQLRATSQPLRLDSSVRPVDRPNVLAQFGRKGHNILLATGQLITEAPPLRAASCLFICFPFSYARKLERVVEALLAPYPGKEQAMVYDYDDIQVPSLHRACEKRAKTLARIQRTVDQRYVDWAQLRLG